MLAEDYMEPMAMWNEIAQRIAAATGSPFEIARRSAVGGGSINQAYCLDGGDRRYFVKVNAAERVAMFEAEAIALAQMHATHTLRVPQPLCCGIAGGSSYIVMEWLDLGGPPAWKALGERLAAMHRITSDRGFGWQQNNTIGSTPQINTWTSDWVTFYSRHRLQYQLDLAKRKGFRLEVPERDLFDLIPTLFATYQPQPSMLHGDLWGGNVAFARTGEPVLIDPALYFGDREADIAMTELFGGFHPQFYEAYDRAFPLDAGYKQRKVLYNLYHLLNHFNLFGGGYGVQANRAIERLWSMAR